MTLNWLSKYDDLQAYAELIRLGGKEKMIVKLIFFLIFAMSAPAFAQDVPSPGDKTVEYSPYPEKTFPNNVYFGDTHLHTSYSTDAGMVGNIRGPADGYRLARGEVITSSHGLKVQ